MKIFFKGLAILMLSVFVTASAQAGVKAGFVYVGPVGDHGWTYMHDQARLQVEEALGDEVETVYVESVKYGPDAERVIRHWMF